MADSINTQVADALISRQLQTGRVESDQRRRVWAILALLEADLLAALKVSDPTEPALLAWRRRRVERLVEDEIAPLVASRYASIAAMTTDALVRLARNEATAVADLVNEITGEETLREPVPASTLRQAVTQTLIPSVATATAFSAIGADWWQRAGATVQQRLGDQLLVSVSLGESLTEAVARVRGTADKAFTDGVMAKAREDAARLVRTEVTNAVSEARVAVADANSEQVRAVEHSSVLDSRTSEVCLARNGLRYSLPDFEPIGHNIPYLGGPPYHPSCRSTMLPLVQGGGAVEGGGFEAFLRRKGTAFQDDVLGPKRAALFRANKLGLRDLIDASTGRPLTLEELGA